MRVLTVIGNRPQFVKAAAVSHALRERATEILVHTGQHYDDELSRVFFDELGLPRAEHRLDLGGGSNTAQTARMLGALEGLIAAEAPDVVLVYGDTNSTLAGALAAAQARIPVAHVEAGMRSFDRAMPEELNRVLTDHASDLLLCSSEVSAANLRAEAVGGEIVVVGDVMVDVAQLVAPRARALTEVLERHGATPGDYVLATAHRAGQRRRPGAPRAARRAARPGSSAGDPAAAPAHARAARRRRPARAPCCRRDAAPPLGYLDFTALLLNARGRPDRLRRRAEGGLPGRRCRA